MGQERGKHKEHQGGISTSIPGCSELLEFVLSFVARTGEAKEEELRTFLSGVSMEQGALVCLMIDRFETLGHF